MYRLLVLINVDYKVYIEILIKRLEKGLKTVIGEH